MRFANLTRLAILLLPISFVSGCATAPAGLAPSRQAVQLPPPPAFMGAACASSAAVGMNPNEGFDAEHAALKDCRRRGAASRSWYQGVRQRYSGGGIPHK
jgi:hypothetical protein